MLDEFLELRTFESFPGLRGVLRDLVDGIAAGPADLVVAFSTPALQTVLRKVKAKPAVFGIVADGQQLTVPIGASQ